MSELRKHSLALGFGAVAAAIISAAVYSGWFGILFWTLVHVVFAALGFYYAVQWNLVCGKRYKPQLDGSLTSSVSVVIQKMMEFEAACVEPPKKVVISRSLDNALQEVIDLICQHFILSWYEPLTKDKRFVKHCQAEMWRLIDKVSRRMSEIDLVSFLSQDVLDCLHHHFKNIRLAKKDPLAEKTDDSPKFVLHFWLRDEEKELDCLRKVSDVILLFLLSKPYGTCAPIRHLMREILSGSVLKSTIDMICDPDYINQHLLDYMSYREKLYADTKRTYMYSATYEGFVKMIKVSESVSDLQQMRYNIISEILQASAINNIKKQKGLTTDKDVAPKGTNKGELLKARNLERYKNQLTVAKQLCEKRIVALGGSIYDSSYQTSQQEDDIPGQKVFSFAVVMEMPQGREYFMRFLKKEGADFYLGFWNAVEKLKSTGKDQWHHVGSEVYQQYIASSSSPVKVDKAILKGMEEFLRGDKGPESFVMAQKQVEVVLEEQYYPSFIVSDTYFLLAASMRDMTTSDEESVASDELFLESKDSYEELEEMVMASQSYHAQQRLRALDSKITNKARALLAQRTSQKLDSCQKLKKVQDDMEQELENLKQERRALEMHISRTQKWIDHIGQWRAHVYDASLIVTDEDRKIPQFVLLVSLSDKAAENTESSQEDIGAQASASQFVSSSNEGWAISRSLEDFYALHEKLAQISSWLQKKELPSTKLFKSLDYAFVQKAQVSLDEYLRAIMQDEKMVHSEAIYAFLSPTPEFVYQPTASEKKNKFSLANLLKSLPNIRSDNQDNDEDFMFGGEDSSERDKSTDSIAKPLYRLLWEVQLKATVDWLVSEQMLIYYTQTFKESMWPDGELASMPAPRSDEQKQECRMQAKTKLLENIPDNLKTLVGEDNARRGVIKIFEVLQHKNFNKHLIYNLIELLIMEVLPEVKRARDKLVQREKRRAQSEFEELVLDQQHQQGQQETQM
ncbi:sorting nexin-25-like [Plakobranchus ocellatus]|uniref:Sorting nexin-25-like n=1 Tax=Plakobranchus ocellatus TaxID=259542 RepID=A0AAV3YBL0_9GAST|nr:sorting nexin-25-like [Plakobranchus ocellatus]